MAADGSAHHPIGHGTRMKRITLDDGRSLLAPCYYRCVPGIGFELLATSALTDLGLKIELDSHGLRIISSDGGATSTCNTSPATGELHILKEEPLRQSDVEEALAGRAATIARVLTTAWCGFCSQDLGFGSFPPGIERVCGESEETQRQQACSVSARRRIAVSNKRVHVSTV